MTAAERSPATSETELPEIGLLNGRFCPLAEVRISPLDRGFIFGDGVYEVIPSYGGHFLLLDEHLDRLDASLSFTRIRNPHSRQDWRRLLRQLLSRNGDGDRSLYLQVTRGVAARDHLFPDTTPTVFGMCRPLPAPNADLLKQGARAVLRPDTRWQHCHAKTVSLIANVLLRQEAADAGAQEAILIRDGWVTEGTASNVFAVIAGAVVTPPRGGQLLHGITRDLVLRLCRDNGLQALEQPMPAADLGLAQELWLTSSTREILPVSVLDDRPVGDGRPGECWRTVSAAYGRFKQRIRDGWQPGR